MPKIVPISEVERTTEGAYFSPMITIERRRHPRKKVNVPTTVVIDGGTKRLPGTICDMSASGARVALSEALEVPEHFYLLVPAHQLQPCRVVWRMPNSLGLSFCE